MLRLTSHMRVLCFICAIAVPLIFALEPGSGGGGCSRQGKGALSRRW